MLARFLQSCCEPSVPMLGQGHDGRGGGAICGHGVCDPAVSDPGLELSDGGGGGGDFRRSIDSFCQARLMVMEE